MKQLTALWRCSWSESPGSWSAWFSELRWQAEACRTAWAAAGCPRKAFSQHIWYQGPGGAPERYPVLKSPIFSGRKKQKTKKNVTGVVELSDSSLNGLWFAASRSRKWLRKKIKLIQKWKDNINDISTNKKRQGSIKANLHYFWRLDLILGPETHTLSPWTQKMVATARSWLGFSSRGMSVSTFEGNR